MRAAIVLAIALSGCAMQPKDATTISAAIAGVEADLAKNGVVSVSHLQTWSPAQLSAFSANVKALQCAQKSPDPIVAMIAGPVTMGLSGSFTQSGSFSITASTMAPAFGLQSEASRTKSQTLTLPVQFVPLSALADAEAQREVEYAGSMLAQNDDLRHQEGQRIQNDRAALSQEVQSLIRGYVGGLCGQSHPFAGGKRNA